MAEVALMRDLDRFQRESAETFGNDGLRHAVNLLYVSVTGAANLAPELHSNTLAKKVFNVVIRGREIDAYGQAMAVYGVAFNHREPSGWC